MAKQLLEINKFQNGTVTTPDATDTPEQSASFSLNLDCVNKDGALQGAPDNTNVLIKTRAGGTAAPNMDKASVIKSVTADNVVKEDVIYWDGNSFSLNFIQNLNLNSTDTILNPNLTPFSSDGISYTSTPLNDITMESHNKEVHIGLGRNQKPKWVGYTNHASLEKSAGELLAVEAEVSYPSAIPHLIKVVKAADNQYLYGVQQGGTRIWKVNSNTGALEDKSNIGTFSNLQSICTNGTDIYLLDRVGKGKIYKISVDNLNFV